jgi:hypothetical protein
MGEKPEMIGGKRRVRGRDNGRKAGKASEK